MKRRLLGWLGLLLMVLAGSAQAQSASANPRYVIQGDSVYDKKTDLTWARCSVGQNWKEGVGCVGIVKKYIWDQAMNMKWENGWRLPSQDELMTLVDQKRKAAKEKPTIDEVAFPDMNLENIKYWSSTIAPDYKFSDGTVSEVGWHVNFGNGNAITQPRSELRSVRLVRGGQ